MLLLELELCKNQSMALLQTRPMQPLATTKQQLCAHTLQALRWIWDGGQCLQFSQSPG